MKTLICLFVFFIAFTFAGDYSDIDNLISFDDPTAEIINVAKGARKLAVDSSEPQTFHAGYSSRKIGQRCGSDQKFFEQDGVFYRFPSGGSYPKIGYHYLEEGHTEKGTSKAGAYWIKFESLYFYNRDSSDNTTSDYKEIDFDKFDWDWDQCELQELNISDTPQLYFLLRGLTKDTDDDCYGVDIYVGMSIDVNITYSSHNILKFVVILYNHPDCPVKEFSRQLGRHNTLGVKFAYLCRDFVAGNDCDILETLNGDFDVSQTLTYNNSQFAQVLSATTACWGQREPDAAIGSTLDENECTPSSHRLLSYGFRWPHGLNGYPSNEKSFRLELQYMLNGRYVITDKTAISLDPFAFRYNPQDFVVPTFPYTPPMLEETANSDEAELVEENKPSESVFEKPGNEQVDFEEVNEVEKPLPVPEIVKEEVVYDTTFRDMSLVAVVAFLGLSLILTFFFARKVDSRV